MVHGGHQDGAQADRSGVEEGLVALHAPGGIWFVKSTSMMEFSWRWPISMIMPACGRRSGYWPLR